MGSFNEICALSRLTIEPGDPVRLLFLTQNPYIDSDGHEAKRGCYIHDQWFVRTPPIKGVYDDYGRCSFEESPITDLIVELFRKDVVERPFSFNQYHTGDVTKSKGIHHFLHAAWQGRLLVYDRGDEAEKENPAFPTWQKIHAMLKKAKLPLQLESDKEDGGKGYNAIPILPGILAVDFNDYGDNTKKLEKVIKVLSGEYDCRLIYKEFQHNGETLKQDPCVLVTVKGGFDDPSLLHSDTEDIQRALKFHPEHRNRTQRKLPVLAVMVREDAWQAYLTVKGGSGYDRLNDAKSLLETAKKKVGEVEKEAERINKNLGGKIEDELEKTLLRMARQDAFRNLFYELPFQIMAPSHLQHAMGKNFPAMEELIQSVTELSRVEQVLSRLQQAWHIPTLGSQDGQWDLQTNILTKILNIAKAEKKRHKEEYEE